MTPAVGSRPRKLRLKKGDKVRVMTGDDKGKTGTIARVYPETGRVLVEGVNLAKKATRPMQRIRQAGMVDVAQPVSASNVMRVCPHCDKPTRFFGGHPGGRPFLEMPALRGVFQMRRIEGRVR